MTATFTSSQRCLFLARTHVYVQCRCLVNILYLYVIPRPPALTDAILSDKKKTLLTLNTLQTGLKCVGINIKFIVGWLVKP